MESDQDYALFLDALLKISDLVHDETKESLLKVEKWTLKQYEKVWY